MWEEEASRSTKSLVNADVGAQHYFWRLTSIMLQRPTLSHISSNCAMADLSCTRPRRLSDSQSIRMMFSVLLLRVAATARALGQVLGPRADPMSPSTIEPTSQSVWTPGQIETIRR